MCFEDFCDSVATTVADRLSGKAEVSLYDVTKNNGVILKGLVVRKKDCRISPTIYLERFGEMYEDGVSLENIADRIVACADISADNSLNAEIYSDYGAVKDRIIYKAVNYSMNRELLDQVPHIRWNDLAVVFCCLMSEKRDGCATILVRNEHMKMWGADTDDLYRAARKNTPVLMKDELHTMDSIIREMMRGKKGAQEYNPCPDEDCMTAGETDPDDDGSGMIHMYVLTNEQRIFGATCMLYSGYFKELADVYESGLYILPSSIHEVIVVPERKGCDTEYMKNMIKEINETQVDLEDRLSDNLYYYDRIKGEIRIVSSR